MEDLGSHGGSYPLCVIPGPRDLTPSPDLRTPGIHMVFIYAWKQDTHIHKNKYIWRWNSDPHFLFRSTCGFVSQDSSLTPNATLLFITLSCTPFHNIGLMLFSLACWECLAEFCLKALMLLPRTLVIFIVYVSAVLNLYLKITILTEPLW